MKIKNAKNKSKPRFNFLLFMLMIVLVSIGLIFVYSASCYAADITYNDKFLNNSIINLNIKKHLVLIYKSEVFFILNNGIFLLFLPLLYPYKKLLLKVVLQLLNQRLQK